jgi:hypothetical protein
MDAKPRRKQWQLIIELLTGLDRLRGNKFTDIAILRANAREAGLELFLQEKIPSWHGVLDHLEQKLRPFALHLRVINICMIMLPYILLATIATLGLLWFQGNPWGSPPISRIAFVSCAFIVAVYLYRFLVEERGVKPYLREIERGDPHWQEEITAAIQALINALMELVLREVPSPAPIRLLLSHGDYQGVELIRKPGVFAYYNFEVYLNPIVHLLATCQKEAKIIIRRPERYFLSAISAASPEAAIYVLTTKAIAKRLRLGSVLAEMRKDGSHIRARTQSIRALQDTVVITERGVWMKAAESRSSTRPAGFIRVQDAEQQVALNKSFREAWQGAEHYPIESNMKS